MSKVSNTDEYISWFSGDIQEKLEAIRVLVKKEIPEATEAMRYGVPAFNLYGNNLIVYAAFKNHIGIYPEPEAIEYFRPKLEWYETAKGTIKFPFDEEFPMDLIKEILWQW